PAVTRIEDTMRSVGLPSLPISTQSPASFFKVANPGEETVLDLSSATANEATSKAPATTAKTSVPNIFIDLLLLEKKPRIAALPKRPRNRRTAPSWRAAGFMP